jgi:hypothetical protein
MIKDDSEIPTSTYQGCDCETCKELNVDCPDCPVCKEEEEGEEEETEDSEVAMAMYDASIGKALFADFGKDYTKVQTERHSL